MLDVVILSNIFKMNVKLSLQILLVPNSDFLNDVGMVVGVDYFFKLLGAPCIKDNVYTI